jgi:hypothetical protein
VEEYCANDGVNLVFIILWVLANIAVISERVYHYMVLRPEVFAVLGHGATIARGAAAALKLDCALLLMTVLRNFLSFIRGTFLGDFLPIDKNIIHHRYIAWSIMFFAMCHM